MSALKDADFFNDFSLVRDPYPYYEALREQGPVVYLPKHNVVFVVGMEEGVSVLRDHETYSSIIAATGPLPPIPFVPESDDITEQIRQYRPEMPFGSMLVAQDPPEHTKMRTILGPLLTPKRLSENEAFMLQAIDTLIDQFADGDAFEGIADFAYPLATMTIADLMGVPSEDHEKFLPLLGKLPGRVGGDDAVENNPMAMVGLYFYEYLTDRRENPRRDVLTTLAQATYPDGSLPSLEEVTTHAATMYGAGQDTTVRLIAAALKTLAENPPLQETVRADHSVIPAFIEEVLRMDGPTKCTFRLAKKPSQLGGIEVKPGMVVMVAFNAMSRDPRVYDRPNEFDLSRKAIQTQVAFGKGIHTCVGAPLARTEAREALSRLLQRVGTLRIDESVHGPADDRHYDYEPNYTQRALRSLSLKFDSL